MFQKPNPTPNPVVRTRLARRHHWCLRLRLLGSWEACWAEFICPEYTLSPIIMVQWKMAIFERGVTIGGTHFFTEPWLWEPQNHWHVFFVSAWNERPTDSTLAIGRIKTWTCFLLILLIGQKIRDPPTFWIYQILPRRYTAKPPKN